MIDLLVVLALIALNGVFAMSEIAVVSANKVRLRQRAQEGDAAARRALELAESPNRFLGTVQIGITLIGIVAGAFGGAALAEPFAAVLARVPLLEPIAGPLAFALVVAFITYLSLVVGELAPKRIGLNDPEGVATAVAGAMHALSVVATPFVRFLSLSTNAVLWLLRVRPREEPAVSEEEINVMVAQGLRAGVIEPAEQEIIENAFWIGERRVRSIMTPRLEVAWLDLDDDASRLRDLVAERPFSRYPLARGGLDDTVGVLHTREALAQALEGGPLDLEAIAERPLFVPESLPVFDLLERFRERGVHFAIVIDEYGGVEGIATLSDILETLVGEVADQGSAAEGPDVVRREDGSLLVDGMIDLESLADELGTAPERFEANGVFETLGGLVAARLGRIPKTGEAFEFEGHRFEVVDMDGRRIDRVLVTPLEGGTDQASIGGSGGGAP